eukprot:CAMPEP_0176248426 /NCGR_PEP_ID=MMETSP0121_2-20121125/33460_1 /TAXON_ID=160619 /ORGANISM="Kryptoperidinium foliaceum, Strain CCMP 1326" /LENGTH=111 /DNA_ID=CAMNT_0017588103 /DNA_START=202 /DNA_END=533 /DNA_ORIENTATION=+
MGVGIVAFVQPRPRFRSPEAHRSHRRLAHAGSGRGGGGWSEDRSRLFTHFPARSPEPPHARGEAPRYKRPRGRAARASAVYLPRRLGVQAVRGPRESRDMGQTLATLAAGR